MRVFMITFMINLDKTFGLSHDNKSIQIFFSMEIVITGSFGNSTFAYSALGLVFPDSFHEAADDYFLAGSPSSPCQI